jgi:hypothetical protein
MEMAELPKLNNSKRGFLALNVSGRTRQRYVKYQRRAAMAKVKVKAIVITRQGGPIETYYDVVLGNWAESDAILKLWARTAPNNGCYDTCNFRIFFEDGNSFSGTYRLRQPDILKNLLAHHIGKVW